MTDNKEEAKRKETIIRDVFSKHYELVVKQYKMLENCAIELCCKLGYSPEDAWVIALSYYIYGHNLTILKEVYRLIDKEDLIENLMTECNPPRPSDSYDDYYEWYDVDGRHIWNVMVEQEDVESNYDFSFEERDSEYYGNDEDYEVVQSEDEEVEILVDNLEQIYY